MNNIEKYVDKLLIYIIIFNSIYFVLSLFTGNYFDFSVFTVDIDLSRPRQLIGVILFVFSSFFFFLAKLKFNINYKILVISSYLSLLLVAVSFESFLIHTHNNANLDLEVGRVKYLEKAAKKAKNLNIDFDARTPYQVIMDFRKNNIEVFPSSSPGGMLHLEEPFMIDNHPAVLMSGISNKMHITINESGKYDTYISDKYGFNNLNPDYEYPIDIMLLGDSNIEGYAVAPEDNIQGSLKKLGTNTISVGKAGHGSLLLLASLIEYAKPLKPKNLIWFYTSYDNLMNLRMELKSPILTRYLDDENFSQKLINKQKEIDDFVIKYTERKLSDFPKQKKKRKHNSQKFISKLKRVAMFDRIITLFSSTLRGGIYVIEDPLYESFRLILSKAHLIAKASNSNLYFVYMPLFTEIEQKKGLNKRVISIVEELNIPMIDIYNKVFLNHHDPLSLFPLRLGHGHYTAEGSNLIARSIYEKIYQPSDK